MTPNARTLAFYEKQGFLAAIVEHWSPFPKPWGKRHDLLGVFDLIVLKPGGEIWGIQATSGGSGGHVADRINKLVTSEKFQRWIALGGKAAVVGWAKRGDRGKRKLWSAVEVILGPNGRG